MSTEGRSKSNSKESLSKSLSNGSTIQKSFYFTPKSKRSSALRNDLDLPDVTVGDKNSINYEQYSADYTLLQDNPTFYTRAKTWFNKKLFGYQPVPNESTEINRKKIRKVPVKVEPKVYFANERTFLSWLNMAVTLASISIGIISFADKMDSGSNSKLYGLLLLPVAIAFCLYALFTYVKRAGMIRRKEPGPYEDKWGPLVLTIMLVLSIALQFCFKVLNKYGNKDGNTSE